jgi:DNA-binding HxlR family transcriptional regulator
MESDYRSGCPINLTLEMLGDRWSLIVIRDLMFAGRRRYRELLTQSEEKIASNILADRLKRLVESGLLSRKPDPRHKQGVLYSLTEPAIRLAPLLVQMGAWGRRHTLASRAESMRIEVMEAGGPAAMDLLTRELRHLHLGGPKPERSVLDELRAAQAKAEAEEAAA